MRTVPALSGANRITLPTASVVEKSLATAKLIRVLHLLPSFGLGGMEKIVCAVLNSTPENLLHQVITLDGSTDAWNWIDNNTVTLVDFDKPKGRARFFYCLYRLLRKIEPDILMTYNWGGTDGVWLGRLAGIKCIIHNEHGFGIEEASATDRRRDAIRFLVYRLANRVIVVSTELKNLLKRRYLINVARVSHIPNGVDCGRYAPDCSQRESVRKGLGIDNTSFVVGFSGRLDAVKNLDHLIHVFAQFALQRPEARLLIVVDGPEKDRIVALCKSGVLRRHTLFVGAQLDVVPYLRAMDVFILTSLREQMPMTVLEAMAVGIPVIATSVGEIPYIIENGINGFIVPQTESADAYVKPLLKLLDRDLRDRVGSAARSKIVADFSTSRMIRQYHSVIERYAPPERFFH